MISDAVTNESYNTGGASGVSWGAIFAGAAAAAALSLILLILGVGLGFSTVSPWAASGASAGTLGLSSIVWIAFTQIAAAGLGGYLAGRLRVKWASVHTDEVYFRDTAHGFLAWAVASLVTAAFLGSAVSAVVGSGVQAGATAASGIAGGAVMAAGHAADAGSKNQSGDSAANNPLNYYVDSLFRADQIDPAQGDPAHGDGAARAQAVTIFAHDLKAGSLSADDKQYLGKVVAQRTGLNQADAEQRVDTLYAQANQAITDAQNAAKQAADKARKAAAYSALWLFVTLLIGAFFASFLATFGGKRRDHIHTVDNLRTTTI